MRVPLKELLEKLAVRHILSPYETAPWVHYDDEKGITCSAEVRMGPDGDEIEAEIQFLYDEKEEDAEDTETQDDTDTDSEGRSHKFHMHAKLIKADTWSPIALTVKGKNYVNELPEWEQKGCDLFQACVQAMQMGTLPDIDDLITKHMDDDGLGGRGGRGKIGRKSPKIKPQQLMGMGKKGM